MTDFSSDTMNDIVKQTVKAVLVHYVTREDLMSAIEPIQVTLKEIQSSISNMPATYLLRSDSQIISKANFIEERLKLYDTNIEAIERDQKILIRRMDDLERIIESLSPIAGQVANIRSLVEMMHDLYKASNDRYADGRELLNQHTQQITILYNDMKNMQTDTAEARARLTEAIPALQKKMEDVSSAIDKLLARSELMQDQIGELMDYRDHQIRIFQILGSMLLNKRFWAIAGGILAGLIAYLFSGGGS